MRKARLFAPMISLGLLLSACGAVETETLDIQAQYQEMTAAQVEAELTCHFGDEVRTYSLVCDYTPESSRVEVTAPESLSGIAATVDGETLQLSYDDVMLDAGIYSGTQLSPMWAVPSMVQAMAEGYPLEYCREDVGETQCLRVTFEVTGEDDEKVYYAVWFGEGDLPLRGEITVDGAVIYMVEFTNFTKEGWNDGTTAAEDLGGD